MKQKRIKSVTLNLIGVTTEDGFQAALRKALTPCGMPETDENHSDALRDVMIGEVRMPRRLEVLGWSGFRAACPDGAETFLRRMDDYNREEGLPACKVVFGDGLSPALFWGPDIFLFALLPVDVMTLLVVWGRFGWKLAVAALFLAIALVTQVLVLACVLSLMQPHWSVTQGHQAVSLVRTLLSLLLFVGSVAGLAAAHSGLQAADGFAVCAGALALAGNAGYQLFLLSKRRA